MSKFWTEPFDPNRHNDRLGQSPASRRPRPDPLIAAYPVYFVRVCSFTFEFHTLDQIEAYLRYFTPKVRPSSRVPSDVQLGGDRHEHQRWYDRLPMWLLEEPKRQKVEKALRDALAHFGRTGPASP